ncbi:GDSL-type esterase/lipase family protein [Microbacterium deminutum]|uniref:D-inositol 3-phosphate glycosyltransferase n=1 Tax=Microbacterium deminutum TaxID=344164 RepID=A0ABN2Q9L5_9MICO
MRVALLAESYLPHMNGVTNSVLQVLRHLEREGHETLVIAPHAAQAPDVSGTRAELLRSVPVPSYPEVRVVFARAAYLTRLVGEFRPDVLHLASPFILGWQGLAAADALRVPAVAVYQTDMVAYAERYRIAGASPLVAAHVARLHRRATLTLAPSSASELQLAALGVDRVRRWGRGVDAVRFDPQRRSPELRARLAPDGRLLVGYVGRLAPEKQVEDLRAIAGIPGIRLVIVGDGPSRAQLEQELPDAAFLGFLAGDALAEAVASLDVFVHPGESETFCQGVQEALASGVPVVATGRGGPLDLVRSSIDGWLYRPGDLVDLRSRVADLVGDAGKRRAFGAAARESVHTRTWEALGHQLVGHYEDAVRLRPIDDALMARAATRPAAPALPATASAGAGQPRWARYIALGDSITEGLCDRSRVPDDEYRGWADRLAMLLAYARTGGERFRYANLAVRSRRVRHVLEEQIPKAIELRPDLVSVLIGANDLVKWNADPRRLADSLADGIRTLRAAGCDVLLVTPFLPRRRIARLLARRFAAYSAHLRAIAAETGAMLLDLEAHPAIGEPELWADDAVHLRTQGHRLLAYRAAEVLGVPDAEALGGLDAVLHADEEDPPSHLGRLGWARSHGLPWLRRRLAGRAAGDGLAAKHEGYVELRPKRSARRSSSA